MTIVDVLATLDGCDFAGQTLTLEDITGIRDALVADLPGVSVEVHARPPHELLVRAGDECRSFKIAGFNGPPAIGASLASRLAQR